MRAVISSLGFRTWFSLLTCAEIAWLGEAGQARGVEQAGTLDSDSSIPRSGSSPGWLEVSNFCKPPPPASGS